MMQQSPRLYASPHAQSLRVLRCPTRGRIFLGAARRKIASPHAGPLRVAALPPEGE